MRNHSVEGVDMGRILLALNHLLPTKVYERARVMNDIVRTSLCAAFACSTVISSISQDDISFACTRSISQ